ncbi:MAG: hypothetical protein ACE14V_16600 [bacterium]
MKKNIILIMLLIVLCAITVYGNSVKWIYQGAIDTTNGLMVDTSERLVLAASDSRGVVYYATYQSIAGVALDIHVYKFENILNSTTRNVTILDTLSSVSVYNQYYGLTTDTADNVYVGYYHTASPFGGDSIIRKYDKNGSMVLGFGSNGTLRPPMIAGLSFKPGALTYLPASNKLIVTSNSSAPDTTYTGRLVGLDANTGVGIDTSIGISTSCFGTSTVINLRYIRSMAYDAVNSNFLTLNSAGLLERWSGGTPADLTGYAVNTVIKNYASLYGVLLQLSFDSEYRQTFAAVSSAVPERYYISVLDLDNGNELQRLTAENTVGAYMWCGGSCLIGSGNNKRFIALDYASKKMHIYAPELPQIAPAGPITISMGLNQDFTASLGVEPYTWSINTISGSPGTLSTSTGSQVTFITSSTGSCMVRCTDVNGLYAELTINVVPTSAPLYFESVLNINRLRLEE